MNDVPADATPHDIRGVLIQIDGARLLLPNTTISEVLSYADPEPVEGAPAWLLGRTRWRGWEVPLVAFSRAAGLSSSERGGLGSKVAVLKNLRTDGRFPYFALLTQGFPRLVNVSADTLLVDAGDGELPTAVHARVRLNQDEALIPDLEAMAALIEDALNVAA
ncbi:chemotaxis protein CheW [Luteimonas yindakuii]|uniref:chemotaxis protein CheW n=1 Tax=Luteimonas yindakuii TaxID=2565782 RepID=UPI0010A35935|nr:chemotaxis protein CheW [Luteimonas yindakuii]QCO68300.1 chemotaxis protein CheW [Luteimonas yindakuii]